MRIFVDVMEVQGQDVVLAANVHAIMVLIHAKDPVVGCVEEVGEVMCSASGSQFCMETNVPINDSCSHICTLRHTHPCATFLTPLLHSHADLSDGFPPTPQ